ncbi:MAG: hypothetical protein ACK4FA_02690 [Candidatus Paceibacteria bacterium]
MDENIDLLKIKIEKARESLPNETREAIDAVPWRDVIYEMRERKGYNLSQLEDLELETELVLCGLVSPQEYPQELSVRMQLPEPQVQALVEEMNERVFKRIRDELVQRINRNQSLGITNNPSDTPKESPSVTELNIDRVEDISTIKEQILKEAEIKKGMINSILEKKLANTHTIKPAKTEYSLGNISRAPDPGSSKANWNDPYRINPGE